MYLLLFFFWIILNGRLTVEIVFLGVSFATLVYAFAWKFMGLTLEKEKIFWFKQPEVYWKYAEAEGWLDDIT